MPHITEFGTTSKVEPNFPSTVQYTQLNVLINASKIKINLLAQNLPIRPSGVDFINVLCVHFSYEENYKAKT